jgi:Na+-driven multidrug efflux pump
MISQIDEYNILFYTSAFSIGPMIFLSFLTGEYEKVWRKHKPMFIQIIQTIVNFIFFIIIWKLLNYDQWSNAGFWFFFIVSSLMGFFLNYSTMMCTKYNSPLTTSVIGCLKVS